MPEARSPHAQPSVEWSRLTAAELNALAAQDAIALLPVASTEQHGPHLATGCDAVLCAEVCRRTAELVRAERPIVVAPTLWVGLASHHVAMGGTFSLTFDTYAAVLRDLVGSLKTAGFGKVLIVNGHGGNIAALSVLTDALTQEFDLPIASTNYPQLATEAGDFAAILEDQPAMHHACEAETSMLLALGGWTREERIAEGFQDGYKSGDASPLGASLRRWRSFKDFTPSGVRGDARRASPEKGARLLDACARRLADALISGAPWSA